MIDTVASSLSAEMTLNEMSADKSLLHLERSVRKGTVVNVPTVEAYQPEAEEQVAKSRMEPLPSKPVPLPTKHSPLYIMKEQARAMSLGKGQRLPETPIDRHVGNEELYDSPEEASAIAVERGLSDLPEYDPSGPNPFRKN